MITIATWFWQQPGSLTHYTPEHVNTWAAMVRRNLGRSHRLVCFTDTPEGIHPWVQCIPTPPVPDVHSDRWSREDGRPQCWRRVALFNPSIRYLLGDRFVSMDLDCIIGDRIDPMLDRQEDLVLCPGTTDARPYNGSMLLMNAGCRPHVWFQFNQQSALNASERFEGSDQAWFAYTMLNEATWKHEEGLAFYGKGDWNPMPGLTRIAFTAGGYKPWQLLGHDDWARKHYRLYDWGDASHAYGIPAAGAADEPAADRVSTTLA